MPRKKIWPLLLLLAVPKKQFHFILEQALAAAILELIFQRAVFKLSSLTLMDQFQSSLKENVHIWVSSLSICMLEYFFLLCWLDWLKHFQVIFFLLYADCWCCQTCHLQEGRELTHPDGASSLLLLFSLLSFKQDCIHKNHGELTSAICTKSVYMSQAESILNDLGSPEAMYQVRAFSNQWTVRGISLLWWLLLLFCS